jgi:hypothetical protein
LSSQDDKPTVAEPGEISDDNKLMDYQFNNNLTTSIDFVIAEDTNKINNVNISNEKEQLEELLVKNLEMLEILKENSNEIQMFNTSTSERENITTNQAHTFTFENIDETTNGSYRILSL